MNSATLRLNRVTYSQPCSLPRNVTTCGQSVRHVAFRKYDAYMYFLPRNLLEAGKCSQAQYLHQTYLGRMLENVTFLSPQLFPKMLQDDAFSLPVAF